MFVAEGGCEAGGMGGAGRGVAGRCALTGSTLGACLTQARKYCGCGSSRSRPCSPNSKSRSE